MSTLKQLLIKEFRQIYQILYDYKYIDEHRDFREECYGRNKYLLSWDGRNSEANFAFDADLQINEIMTSFLKNEQFSLKFYDKSILQVEYLIANDIVTKQRIQFFKKSNRIRSIEEINHIEKEEAETGVEGSNWFEDEKGIPVVLRVDYDPDNHEDLFHSKSHFVLSNLKDCRIPMYRVLSLTKFVELILHQVYNDYSFTLHDVVSFEDEITIKEKSVVHINW